MNGGVGGDEGERRSEKPWTEREDFRECMWEDVEEVHGEKSTGDDKP